MVNKKDIVDRIEWLKRNCSYVYIYGFGSYGRNVYSILKKENIYVDGFVVTKKSTESDNVDVPVHEIADIDCKNVGFILGLNENNKKEVIKVLLKKKVQLSHIVDAGQWLENNGNKRGMSRGSIEVTTVIGCSVNCKFCPQSMLLREYYKNNINRTNRMSVDTFRKCLDFFPKDYDISFGGMSEPFLNKDFIQMLEIACDSGRKIALYTTLVGLQKEDANRVLQLPIDWVTLHVADKYSYANIPQNEEYYSILNMFINARKQDGTLFVNMCNAQSEPNERVLEICNSKYEILTEMTDRAGNLSNDRLIHNKVLTGKIKCGNSANGALNSNVVLPDGSVVLCCMDYGLQHILGNIYENSFEEIMNGLEMQRVRAGMDGDKNIDILCRKCSYARMRS